jgi:splicing factor U2AF 65 kDa subunit
VEEASNVMALDGIMFEGAPVKVRRPTDYNPSLADALGPSQPNPNLNLSAVGLTGSAGGLDGPDRVFVCVCGGGASLLLHRNTSPRVT